MREKIIYVGIDAGVFTGVSVRHNWSGELILKTLSFWKAFNFINSIIIHSEINIVVVIEDVTQNKPVFSNKLGKNARINLKIAQNVGGVKRETQLWIDYFESKGVEVIRVKPTKKSQTKLDKKIFEKLTGYKGRCSQHARDATMLIIGR